MGDRTETGQFAKTFQMVSQRESLFAKSVIMNSFLCERLTAILNHHIS